MVRDGSYHAYTPLSVLIVGVNGQLIPLVPVYCLKFSWDPSLPTKKAKLTVNLEPNVCQCLLASWLDPLDGGPDMVTCHSISVCCEFSVL